MAAASACFRRQDRALPAYPALRIADAFGDLVDPRVERTKRHRLLDILTSTLCGVLGGAENWVEIADWADAKRAWLTEWLGLQHGVPAPDPLGRVFDRLDPVQCESGFLRWVQGTLTPHTDPVIAIDAKTVRRSGDACHGHGPLHLVRAWASGQRLVLSQEAGAGKSNEITAIPLLLERLDLTGQTVTIDAMGCQRTIAAQIIAGGGDYVLARKDTHPDPLEEVIACFRMAPMPADRAATIGKDHGRRETRVCETIDDPAVIAWLDPDRTWLGLRSIARVTATRTVGDQDPITATRSDLTSLPAAARPIAAAVRSHWGIENGLPWVLDLAFGEDQNRTRAGHSAETLALVRKLALNLLRLEPTRKHGIKASRLRAGWDHDYLLRGLGAG